MIELIYLFFHTTKTGACRNTKVYAKKILYENIGQLCCKVASNLTTISEAKQGKRMCKPLKDLRKLITPQSSQPLISHSA